MNILNNDDNDIYRQHKTNFHLIPGRLRAGIPGLLNNQDLAFQIAHRLAKFPGVRMSFANPITGQVLVNFDPSKTDLKLLLVETGIQTDRQLNPQTGALHSQKGQRSNLQKLRSNIPQQRSNISGPRSGLRQQISGVRQQWSDTQLQNTRPGQEQTGIHQHRSNMLKEVIRHTAAKPLPEQIPWHALDLPAALTLFESSAKTGLSHHTARERLKRFGFNELKGGQKTSFWQIARTSLNGFMTKLLLVAGGVSLLVGETTDAAVIVAIVVVQAAVEAAQSCRAEKSLENLKEFSAPLAVVLREGRVYRIPSKEIVPGDILHLGAGDLVPADAILLGAVNLTTNEACLTGESIPVAKDNQKKNDRPLSVPVADQVNMLFSGTSIIGGRATAMVVTTGMQTELGRIALLLGDVQNEQTNLQKQLDYLGKKITHLVATSVGTIAVINLLRGRPLLEVLRSGISLAVGAVPEGLPAVLTVALSAGVQRMARRNALVRNISAVETLGSTTVICTDKTGTLTKNEMTVKELYVDRTFYRITGDGYQPDGQILRLGQEYLLPGELCAGKHHQEDLSQADLHRQQGAANPFVIETLKAAVLCNNAALSPDPKGKWKVTGDPTEGALLTVAAKAGLWWQDLREKYCRHQEIAFDAKRRLMTVVCLEPDGEYGIYVKGAPDMVINYCSFVLGEPRAQFSDLQAPGSNLRLQAGTRRAPEGNPRLQAGPQPGQEQEGYPRPRTRAGAVLLKEFPDREEGYPRTWAGTPYAQNGNPCARSLDLKTRQKILVANEAMARKALRVLAIAYKKLPPGTDLKKVDLEADLIFCGLAGMADTPREGVQAAIQKCQAAGVKVIMITGDHQKTAEAIATKLGILGRGKSITGKELEQISDAEFNKQVDSITVYSRTTPDQKLKIVRALKNRGQIVAMTGDGVNDAPAVKEADIGIAMGITGTDVTREVAGMTLSDDNFVTIVKGIEEGRTVGMNLTKSIRYILSGSLSQLFTAFTTAILGLPPPLLPAQILWINLVTESLPAISLTADPPEENYMNRPPFNPEGRFLADQGKTILRKGVLFGLTTFGLYAVGLTRGGWSLTKARTMAFSQLVINRMFNLLNERRVQNTGGAADGRENPFILPAAAISTSLLAVTMYLPFMRPLFSTVPINLKDWLLITANALVVSKVDSSLENRAEQQHRQNAKAQNLQTAGFVPKNRNKKYKNKFEQDLGIIKSKLGNP